MELAIFITIHIQARYKFSVANPKGMAPRRNGLAGSVNGESKGGGSGGLGEDNSKNSEKPEGNGDLTWPRMGT